MAVGGAGARVAPPVGFVADWDEDGGLRPKQGRLLADEFEQSALEWSGSHFTGSQGIIGTKQHPVWV